MLMIRIKIFRQILYTSGYGKSSHLAHPPQTNLAGYLPLMEGWSGRSQDQIWDSCKCHWGEAALAFPCTWEHYLENYRILQTFSFTFGRYPTSPPLHTAEELGKYWNAWQIYLNISKQILWLPECTFDFHGSRLKLLLSDGFDEYDGFGIDDYYEYNPTSCNSGQRDSCKDDACWRH